MADSPDRTPRADARAIDFDHLARMTFGDRRLEQEVLQLFERQAMLLLERIQLAPPDAASAMAHTLKGSAQGIGAWKIATAAERVEQAAARSRADLPRAVEQLAAAIDEARLVITDLLRAA
jgi:HPt (histidine-containing phosphotransfer) domain-containing protein